MASRQRPRIFSDAVNLVIQSVLSPELVVYVVSSQFCKLLVSRRHVRSEQPPRPVGPRPGGEVKRRRVRPSVRPSPFFNSSVQHACLRLINVMLEMSFTVVFIVSSSIQCILNAVRAKGQTRPYIALIAPLYPPALFVSPVSLSVDATLISTALRGSVKDFTQERPQDFG